MSHAIASTVFLGVGCWLLILFGAPNDWDTVGAAAFVFAAGIEFRNALR